MNDQQRAPNPLDHWLPADRRDQRTISIDRSPWWVLIALSALFFSCVRAPAIAVTQPPREELWVDAFSTEPGDGGRAAPLKVLVPPTTPATVHLRSGLYRGPFSFSPGTIVEGHGQVVLFLDAPGVVIPDASALTLRGLTVQGGDVGIAATGNVTLERVEVSGQRTALITVADAGLNATEVTLTTRIDGAIGLDAVNSAVSIDRVNVHGPLRHGVRAANCTSTVKQLHNEGAATALQVRGGRVDVDVLSSGLGTGAAVTLADTTATLKRIDLSGHEYGLLVSGGSVSVDGFVSRAAAAAAISTVDATVKLDAVRIDRAGNLGGVQLLRSTSTVGQVLVAQSSSTGLFIRQGSATVKRLDATAIRAEIIDRETIPVGGDALQVREAIVDVETLSATDCEGAAVYATNDSTVRLGTLESTRSAVGAIVVERKSDVHAVSVVSAGSRGPALSVPDEGRLTVKHLSAQGADLTVWADCDTGSVVHIEALAAGTVLPRLRCLLAPK